MGRGLQIEPTGLHVAFCAGTGVLVFLDLVAHLLLVNTLRESVPEPMRKHYQSGFKLILYCSFQSRDQAIGLDLIEALEQVCTKLGLDNFRAIVRLTQTDGPKLPRWTPEYIEKELEGHSGQLRKVWVVGPPQVNETFDKTLGQLSDKLKLQPHQIDVM